MNTPARRPILNLTLFGPFVATIGNATLKFKTRKARAVLAYVALGDVAGESRERLHGLLWSESDTERAQVSLRAALKELKALFEATGFTGFNAGKQTLSFDRSLVETDVDQIVTATEAGQAHPLLLQHQRLADTLLSDLEMVDPQFHAWVQARRHALHDRITTMLEQALPAEIGNGSSVDLGQALQSLDPTNEIACRHVIRCRVARGEIGGALKAYKVLWDELDNEFDTEPSPETQDLIVKLKQQSGWSTRPGEALADELPVTDVNLPAPTERERPRKLFVVVDDFDVDGVPERYRYVIKGFRHDLSATLARFREWSVRPKAIGSRARSQRSNSVSEYILSATAMGGVDGFRLIATLQDEAEDIIWSQPYTLQSAELLASQQSIVRQMATALNVNISADRLRRLANDHEPDLYERWLEAQSMIQGLRPGGWAGAESILRELMDVAPDFSPAYSSMVQVQNSRHLAVPGVFRRLSEHAKCLELAQRAVRLDPLDSRAQLSLAWSHLLLGKSAQATLHAELAVELNGNDSWTLMSASHIFGYGGAPNKGVALAERSIEISLIASPAQRTYGSITYFLAQKYPECAAIAAGGVEHAPGLAIFVVAALAHLGQHQDARSLLARIVSAVEATWKGAEQPPPRDVVWRWLLHQFPFDREEDWRRLQQGLILAGADAASVTFGAW